MGLLTGLYRERGKRRRRGEIEWEGHQQYPRGTSYLWLLHKIIFSPHVFNTVKYFVGLLQQEDHYSDLVNDPNGY